MRVCCINEYLYLTILYLTVPLRISYISLYCQMSLLPTPQLKRSLWNESKAGESLPAHFPVEYFVGMYLFIWQVQRLCQTYPHCNKDGFDNFSSSFPLVSFKFYLRPLHMRFFTKKRVCGTCNLFIESKNIVILN